MKYRTSLTSALSSGTKHRKTAKTDKINGLPVDTCYAPDTDEWETGIKKNGEWKIVQHYPEGEQQAEKGHKKWCSIVKENPESNKIKDCEDIEYSL